MILGMIDKKNIVNNIVNNNRAPNIGDLVGPALQQAIEEVNKSVLNLLVVSARLGDAEPLAPALLGVSREVLNELANTGRADMLIAQAHGLPLVDFRIKDANSLQTVIKSGFASQDAMSVILKSMPIEVISKINKKR